MAGNDYCYPNCFILKNKLNIKDSDLLEEAERQITAIRILEIKIQGKSFIYLK